MREHSRTNAFALAARRMEGPEDSTADPTAKLSEGEAKPSEQVSLERRIRTGAARYHCNYCQRDITNLFRVKCATCADFDLCLECFSVGVEVFPHKKDHDYRVMDNMTFPIFEHSWGADEELLLLEAIQLYGMGNWLDVQEHVGTKTKQECEEHYLNTYIRVDTCPFPDPERYVDPTKLDRRQVSAREDRRELPRRSETSGVQETRSLVSNPKQGSQSHIDVAGYMPLRNDFEVEYDNEAEMIIADMEITPSDSAEDRELKLKLLELYDAKLNERRKRKRFVLDRGFLEFRKIHAQERRKSKEERELHQRLRVLARFHTPEQHQRLIDGILKERELRKRIALLQEYRKNGLRTLAEAQVYQQDKKKHEEELRKCREDGMYSRPAQRSRYAVRDRSANPVTPAKNLRKSAALDLTGCPGVELLSEKEKQLCSSIRILPRQYLLIKDVLIRESERAGYLDQGTAVQLLKIEAKKTGEVYEFFVTNGWIKPNSQGTQGAVAEGEPASAINLSM